MRVLIHVCCAPCLTYPHELLLEEGHDVTGFWYNPNVQPFLEYLKRLHEVQRYTALRPVEVIYADEYPLREWLARALNELNAGRSRCSACYRDRIFRTALTASEMGFDAFTTTLLLSKHQKHEEVRDLCREAMKRYGVEFIYRDLRKGWRRSIKISRDLQLYRQSYCGCIFSEFERLGVE